MVAVAVRVAQRMGMPYESSYKSPPCSTALEAEMRRRLWWALVLLDHRLCEIVGQERSSALTPTWDCRPPLNVSDFELQADAKRGPSTHEKSPTEALFVVVRSELADYVRHSPSHAKGTSGEDSSPSSSSSSSSVVPNESDRPPRSLDVLETHMDATHLSQCNPEIPLHYMTVWAARGFFARRRLTEHYLAHAASDPPKRWTDAQRSTAYESALLMLECDTALRRSPLVAGFLWLVDAWSSPVFAYVHLLNGLTRRPGEGIADRAWRTMSDHYEAVAKGPPHHRTRLMFDSKFPRFILRAWEAREAWHTQKNNALPMLPPRLVLEARERAVQTSSAAAAAVRSNSPDERWLGLEPSRAAHADSSTAVRCLFSTSGGVGGQQAQASGGEVQGFGMAMPADLLQGGPSQGTTDMPDLVVDQFWSDNVFEWM
ncbi:hypothetical protein VTK73DRAFT_8685 [Phialemonium thermophilum]|uniref:Xylanolytic transcriptional activator regulatory domain-containing protein n=1 Tax=Phialemonium thermophilum TaxID=223376 RepID=A0ABR3W748_9PEZI